MAKADLIKAQVTEYYKNNPIGDSAADAFAPWWMAKTFSISAVDANRQCTDGGKALGIDGFHLEELPRGAILHLVQAQMTDNRGVIKKAITDFEKPMRELAAILKGKPDDKSNSVLSRLAAALEKHDPNLKSLKLNFVVLHFNEEAKEVLWNAVAGATDRFNTLARQLMGSHPVTLKLCGPDDIDPSLMSSHVPAEEQTLSFDGVKLATDGDVQYFAGIGKLCDLVQLYKEYGDQLFAKNVRAFLYKAAERGPARHMRETLRTICDKRVAKAQRVPPHNFAIFHNGVTLYAQSAQMKGGRVTVREPSILNGCQTVKNAYLFRFNQLDKHADEKLWEAIPVPLRIIVTSDEELIRNVTVSNNRQNSIRASAFRANDPTQLELGERFRAMKIFYERQEGAFDNLRKSNPRLLDEAYGNSVEGPLMMEELAQAIAIVGNQPALSLATKVSDLFEDAQYKRIFSGTHLKKLELLVFLRNMSKVTGLALKDLRGEVAKLGEMSHSSFRFPAMRILARYVVKHQPDLVAQFGGRVENRIGTNHPLRAELKRFMRHNETGLQQLLHDHWFDASTGGWKSATDKDCVEAVLRKLRLADVDVFSL